MHHIVMVFCLAALAVTPAAFAQQMEDVVHLKNGSTIRCTVIERILGESLKIKTQDGSVYIYTMEEIEKIVREPVKRKEGHLGPELVPPLATRRGEEAVRIFNGPMKEAGSRFSLKMKEPWLACGLSILIPGAGQFYNGQYKKGVIQLGAALAGSGLIVHGVRDNYEDISGDWIDPKSNDGTAVFGGFLWLGGLLWSAIDAPISANLINRQNRHSSQWHLFKVDCGRAVLGVDTVFRHYMSGARLTLHIL